MPRPAGRPTGAPVGLQLARTSRAVSPALEEALAGAGESVPTWLVQISLSSPLAAQPAGAGRGGGNPLEAALTHHLNATEAGGLIIRRRGPASYPGQEGQDR
jgi:MarR family transcriptional regulator for hemolysin